MLPQPHLVYIQVHQNRFRVYWPVEDKQYGVESGAPFSSSHLAVGNIDVAAKQLKQAIDHGVPASIFRKPIIAVIQQCHFSDEPLTEVEKVVLIELSRAAGAQQVYVWQQEPLTQEQLLAKRYFQ
ncbi:hypothetical protein ABT56_13010 [Photobacterium aquae]|uniref:Uncharacterized protein n=1 Tax=Photobacterium aquae TaxID=1195763 RepID=A0A0J1GZP3_9GAMM|nr:hypothetical protein [Photobacterium aquae]KLV05111.1 hypothetical protein ABT56_13010 [Photobacterium aquae]